jgi:hypothetical protein
MTTRFARASAAAAAVFAVAVLHAATPTFWVVSTQADFLEGEVESVSIDDTGRLTLGPATSLVAETSAPALWSILPAAAGGYWVGSGNEGRVLRIAADGQVSTFFDAEELEVHALAPAPDGGLFAATSPDGRIYRISRDGHSTVYFDPDDKYIWALAVDPSGVLYAGTGEKGVIYRITPDGQGRPFYDTRSTNVVCLAFDAQGRLLAGTDSPGRVFRIDAGGKGFVLLDSPFKEVHAIHVTPQGTIYAAAIDGKAATGSSSPATGPAGSPASVPVPMVSSEIVSFAVIAGATASAPQTPAAAKSGTAEPKGAIYRIQPDGVWDSVWESSDDTPFDVAVDPAGDLTIGTGDTGKIFRVSGDPSRVTLVTRADARQVTQLLRGADGSIMAVTSNPGKVVRLSRGPADHGTYLSEVRDAKTVASWGAIRWHATGGRVEISTRSGNTSTPDSTWSDWSSPYADAGGDEIRSPKARYLQWRAVLSGEAPALTSVTAAFLAHNQKPVVAGITVHPPGTVFQRPFPTGDVVEFAGFESTPVDGRPGVGPPPMTAGQPIGRRFYQKGLQTLTWNASDEDDETLQYDVYYRRDDETEWKLLKRGLWDPIFVWDTTSVPDGSYTLRVVASDAPVNSPATALTGEAESESFDIDNTPPHIEFGATRREPGRLVIGFTVRDDHSAVKRVEYSVDAEQWKAVYPTDGIPDSRQEAFELVLEGSDAARSVIIRATDAMNNVATAVGGQTR